MTASPCTPEWARCRRGTLWSSTATTSGCVAVFSRTLAIRELATNHGLLGTYRCPSYSHWQRSGFTCPGNTPGANFTNYEIVIRNYEFVIVVQRIYEIVNCYKIVNGSYEIVNGGCEFVNFTLVMELLAIFFRLGPKWSKFGKIVKIDLKWLKIGKMT